MSISAPLLSQNLPIDGWNGVILVVIIVVVGVVSVRGVIVRDDCGGCIIGGSCGSSSGGGGCDGGGVGGIDRGGGGGMAHGRSRHSGVALAQLLLLRLPPKLRIAQVETC
jgi:hypothetical protein